MCVAVSTVQRPQAGGVAVHVLLVLLVMLGHHVGMLGVQLLRQWRQGGRVALGLLLLQALLLCCCAKGCPRHCCCWVPCIVGSCTRAQKQRSK
jgi:hypothetical protein